jgi:DNA-binding response OmpR family regulator
MLSSSTAIQSKDFGSPKILLIEDELMAGVVLVAEFAKIPFQVELATSSTQGMRDAFAQNWSALVIDLRSPVDSGLELCKALWRRNFETPILLVVAGQDRLNYLIGLELGAADCLTRPYDAQEIAIRLKAIVRRRQLSTLKAQSSGRSDSTCVYGALTLDSASRIAALGTRVLDLTPREFDLLDFLARNSGTVFSRSDLLRKVWRSDYKGLEHTVHGHINRLRTKLRDSRVNPRFIHTVWSKGYRFEAKLSVERDLD